MIHKIQMATELISRLVCTLLLPTQSNKSIFLRGCSLKVFLLCFGRSLLEEFDYSGYFVHVYKVMGGIRLEEDTLKIVHPKELGLVPLSVYIPYRAISIKAKEWNIGIAENKKRFGILPFADKANNPDEIVRMQNLCRTSVLRLIWKSHLLRKTQHQTFPSFSTINFRVFITFSNSLLIIGTK